jgi:hypothetical protein
MNSTRLKVRGGRREAEGASCWRGGRVASAAAAAAVAAEPARLVELAQCAACAGPPALFLN